MDEKYLTHEEMLEIAEERERQNAETENETKKEEE